MCNFITIISLSSGQLEGEEPYKRYKVEKSWWLANISNINNFTTFCIMPM
jgi:hypothetical protein